MSKTDKRPTRRNYNDEDDDYGNESNDRRLIQRRIDRAMKTKNIDELLDLYDRGE